VISRPESCRTLKIHICVGSDSYGIASGGSRLRMAGLVSLSPRLRNSFLSI